MHYLELIQSNPLVWGLFIGYLLLTLGLSVIGWLKTGDMESFAVGGGDMNPIVVGITLAASIASTATFVINPGFVYVHGYAALMHFGVAAGSGVILGLLIMSFGFRRVGKETNALTLPQWIGQRYQSPFLSLMFAGISLLSLTFAVLIVGALSIVMQAELGLSNLEAITLIICFVFGYIFIGGTYAHAYTNTVQGILMTIVAAIIVAEGLPLLMTGEVTQTIAQVNPDLVKWVNPSSTLFNSVFSIYISGFVVGFALMTQPHILIKALYVKTEKEVWQYLGVAIVVSLIFSALLFVGLYAHLKGMGTELFMDTNGNFRQDMVMAVYITESFSDTWRAVIMVALMSAGMSTLDGILVALSSVAANDLFRPLTQNSILKGKSAEEQSKISYFAGQGILVSMGVLTFLIVLNPPKLLGIFGQVGAYAIVSASLAPVLCGILFPNLTRKPVTIGVFVALGTHFGLYGLAFFQTSDWAIQNFSNPAVPAVIGIFLSLAITVIAGMQSNSISGKTLNS